MFSKILSAIGLLVMGWREVFVLSQRLENGRFESFGSTLYQQAAFLTMHDLTKDAIPHGREYFIHAMRVPRYEKPQMVYSWAARHLVPAKPSKWVYTDQSGVVVEAPGVTMIVSVK